MYFWLCLSERKREKTERIFHWSSRHDMIFSSSHFSLISLHHSLQGKNLSGDALISQSVSLLLSISAKTNCSLSSCSFHAHKALSSSFVFLLLLPYTTVVWTIVSHIHSWDMTGKSEQNPSSQVSRTCSWWIVTEEKARQPLRDFCLVLHWSQSTSTSSQVVQFTVQPYTHCLAEEHTQFR